MIEIGQFYQFLLAITIGLATGLLYEANALCRFFFKNRVVILVVDIAFFLLFGVCYIFFATVYFLPDFRLYLAIGCLLGFFLYYKSLHKIVAFSAKKCYTKYKSLKGGKKLCKREKKSKER